MAQTFDHLHTGVWSFLDESQDERITRLYMPKWVSYAGASDALARMEHLLRHPPCGRIHEATFQFVHVLKGWIEFEYEGQALCALKPGPACTDHHKFAIAKSGIAQPSNCSKS